MMAKLPHRGPGPAAVDQVGVALEHPEQHADGAEQEPGRLGPLRFQPNAVANVAADGLASLVRDPGRNPDRRDPAGLGADHRGSITEAGRKQLVEDESGTQRRAWM